MAITKATLLKTVRSIDPPGPILSIGFISQIAAICTSSAAFEKGKCQARKDSYLSARASLIRPRTRAEFLAIPPTDSNAGGPAMDPTPS